MLVAAALGSSSAVRGQAIQDPAQRLLREQQEKQRQAEQQRSTPAISTNAPQEDLTRDPAEIAEAEPSFLIDRVDFEGDALLLSASQLQHIAQAFEGKRLGNQRIQYLLKRLTAAYIQAGYITTRCYIPEQNLATGRLRVVVVPGRIGGFRLNGKPGLSRLAKLAFPTHVGDVLRLTDLEQGVDQLGRFQFYKPQIAIEPGDKPGESVVAVTLADPRWTERWGTTLGADNQGSRSTGSQRVRLGQQWSDYLGFGEDVTVSYVGGKNSNALTATTGTAWGYNTFTASGTYSEYVQPVGDIAVLFGDSRSAAFTWNRVWQRDATGRWSTDLSLTQRRANRYINDAALTPQNLLIARASASRQWRFARGNASLDIGVSQGLDDGKTSRDAAGLATDAPHAQFTKYDVSASLQWAINADWQIKEQLGGQWSDRGLYGSEQLFLGGVATVRGFQEDGLTGERGAYLRSELAHAPMALPWGGVTAAPFAFADIGSAQSVTERRWKSLGAVGVGARVQSRAFTLDLLYGVPVFHPFAKSPTPRVVLTLTAQF